MKFFFSSIFFLTFSFYSFADQQFKLTRYDVKDTMEKMLAYHVENKEFSPLLAKRSFRIFIEQFDRDKIYLLKGELESFFDIDGQSLNKVIAGYQNDQFEKYKQLAAVIESAIRRSQEIRKELKAALIENKKGEGFEPKEYLSYAQTREELKGRIRERLEKQMAGKLKSRNIEGGDREIMSILFCNLQFRHFDEIPISKHQIPNNIQIPRILNFI
ncbi:MAG: hypothetical protein HYZ47_00095 [Simkania negevensis]|nr:hypothetical protein [Simkania negevensis]